MEESRTYSDRFLELKVLTLCFRSDKCFERKQQVNEDMFTSKDTKIMMKFLESFSDHFDYPEEWWEYLRVYAKPRMDEYEIEELEELFFSMWEDDEGNSDAVFESLLEQIRAYTYGRRVFAAVKDAVTHFKEGEPLKAKTTLEDAVLANANDGRIIQRGDFFEGLEQRIAKYKRGIDSGEQLLFPVGIRAIDEILPWIPKGSLCFYSGRTNIGKTFLLLETALQGCIANGFKVLVVSLELFMDVLEVRWDSMLTG